MSILVSGSVHLDVLAVTPHSTTVDRPGHVHIGFGGTAYNILVTLSGVSAPCRFLGVMAASPITEMLLSDLRGRGVQLQVERSAAMLDGGFSAHVHRRELFSAVACTPIESITIPYETAVSAVRAAIADGGLTAVIVDMNHSVGTVNHLVRAANALEVPVWLCGVSELKACKLASIKGAPSAICLNEREIRYVMAHRLGNPSLERASALLRAPLVITRGAEGVMVVDADGIVCQEPSALTTATGHFLGLGDAFAAHLVRARLRHQPWHEAVRSCQNALLDVAASHSCNSLAHVFADTFSQINSRAETDPLTGTLNRGAMEQVLGQAVQAREPGILLFVDVDQFKVVNDTYGHAVGDQVLLRVTQALGRCVRRTDRIGRWGGDEFIVWLQGAPEVLSQSLGGLLERVRADLQAGDPPVSISVGTTAYQPGWSLPDWLGAADTAMYAHKMAREVKKNPGALEAPGFSSLSE